MRLVLGERPLELADILTAAGGGMRVGTTAALRQRMQAARGVLDDHLSRNVPVYGLTTGMGANTSHRIAPTEAAALQADLVMARIAGIGDALPVGLCRAILFCRIAGLAQGGAGISLPAYDLLVAMLERDVIPAIPGRGSTGASDLVQTTSLAAAAIGEGQCYFGGRIMASAEALRAAGLASVTLAPKDGLSLGSSSAASCATAALALVELEDLVAVQVCAAALACQGFGANPHIFDPRVAQARPAGAQVAAARLFRLALEGGDFFHREPSKVQDAISFRALPQVIGTLFRALETARGEVLIELNAASDNPLVLAQSGEILPTANFMTATLALSLDNAAIALAQTATGSVQRSIKLMTGRLSGLPNYLSPVGGASAGFVPLQKSLAALHAEIRLKATPAGLDAVVVSDMVEDLGSNCLLAATKLREQIDLMRWHVSIEAMLGAQAVDLRQREGTQLTLGAGAKRVYDTVRTSVATLDKDRPTGPDAASVRDRLWTGENVAGLRALLDQIE